jgi:aspartyl-tRNA synthetase
MLEFGTDKPDLRNPLRIIDVSNPLVDSGLRVFRAKIVRGIPIKGLDNAFSRSQFEKIQSDAVSRGAPGLAWITRDATGKFKGPVAKQLSDSVLQALFEKAQLSFGDGLFVLASDEEALAHRILSDLRNELGMSLGLIEQNAYRFCWVTDFPMYQLTEEGQIDFFHNPFSMPQGGLEVLNCANPLNIIAHQYDIVCNGVELSSGAIRNHHPEIMYRAFEIAGYSRSEVDEKFRALVRALHFGPPPHGGIAPGVDRIVMLLANEPNIREVIAFPLTQNAEDLLMNAPAEVTPNQLKDLHIRIDKKKA